MNNILLARLVRQFWQLRTEVDFDSRTAKWHYVCGYLDSLRDSQVISLADCSRLYDLAMSAFFMSHNAPLSIAK